MAIFEGVTALDIAVLGVAGVVAVILCIILGWVVVAVSYRLTLWLHTQDDNFLDSIYLRKNK